MEKTDYKITEFHNSEFGSIRMIEDGGRLLFSGMDVAFALGYAKPRNAINVHCKGALKRGVLTSGGVQPMIFIPEGDVYRLITKSRLKSAQNFEKISIIVISVQISFLEKSQDLRITNKQTKSLLFASYIHLNNFYPIRYAKLTHRFFITRR